MRPPGDAPGEASPGEVTRLLAALRDGDSQALDRLVPLVYRELRRLAHLQLRRRHGHTLSTTALVHEAYVKLADGGAAGWRDREHFFAVAATAMRHILVDAARRRSAGKRGGGVMPVQLDEAEVGTGRGVAARSADILAVDQALASLGRLDDRLVKLVELRFFAGLSVAETAGVLAVSERTVKRDWRKARAFLYRALRAGEGGGTPGAGPSSEASW